MSKKKKALITISLIVLLFFSVFSIIIIDQIIKNDQKIEQNTRKEWCINSNDLECIANNAQIINKDTEICKKVLADPISYFKEYVERCKLVLRR